MPALEPGIQVRSLPLADHRHALRHQLLHVREFGGLLELCHAGLLVCRPLRGVLAQQPSEWAGGGQLGRRQRRCHGRGLARRMHPRGDQRSRPRKALMLHLPPPAGLLRTARCEAALEVGEIRLDFPGATIAALVEREGLRPDPAADGLGSEAPRRSNLAEGLPLGNAGRALRLTVRPSGVPGTLRLLEPRGTPRARQGPRCGSARWRLRCLWDGRRRGGGLTGPHTAEGGRDPLQRAGQHLVEVTESMQAIGALGSLRRALCSTAGIGLGTVAGNDCDAWMGAQPRRAGLGSTRWQAIHRPPAFEIDQDGSRDPALAEGNIIDPQDPGRGRRGRRGAGENAQDRIATAGHPQAGSHPRAGCAARLAPADADRRGQPPRALRVVGGERWQAFGTGLARTRGGGTTEPPDLEAEPHGVLRDGQVAQVARRAALHVCRRGVTIRAGGLGCTGTSLAKEEGISGGDVCDHKAREAEGKHRRHHTSRDTSSEAERFCVSLKYTPLGIVWPCSTKPAEEPGSM